MGYVKSSYFSLLHTYFNTMKNPALQGFHGIDLCGDWRYFSEEGGTSGVTSLLNFWKLLRVSHKSTAC